MTLPTRHQQNHQSINLHTLDAPGHVARRAGRSFDLYTHEPGGDATPQNRMRNSVVALQWATTSTVRTLSSIR